MCVYCKQSGEYKKFFYEIIKNNEEQETQESIEFVVLIAKTNDHNEIKKLAKVDEINEEK